MGKGLALQFKNKYPTMFTEYVSMCENKNLFPGKLHIWKGDKIIINFPTKIHWKNNSKYEYIDAGLKCLKHFLIENPQYSIAIPPLGCGNGGLNWEIVCEMIKCELSELPNIIHVYEPLS